MNTASSAPETPNDGSVAHGLSPQRFAALPTARGRVRLRTLAFIRWVAIAGQATTLLVVHVWLGYSLPLWPALLMVAASALVNVWATLGRPAPARLGDREVAFYLGFDLLQLAGLLYLTGGLDNPFAVLILAPVTVSATVLSRASTIALSLIALAVVVVLAFFHLPLPWPDDSFVMEPVLVLGLGLALVVATLFVATYVFSVSEEARRMSDALAATQMALDREQRLSALGGLAAAAAHELGSPLGTIAVIAKELARDLPPDSPLKDDAELLISQSARCRDILAGLAARPETDGGSPYSLLSLPTLIEVAAAPYRGERVRLVLEVAPAAGGEAEAPPVVARSPGVLHGLGNLIQNAVQFARAEVRIVMLWTDSHISVSILDDGPGFDPSLLEHLGEPYLSGGSSGRAADSDGEGDHMGLGVFIAQNLLERTGARLSFGNRAENGAAVTATWRRADFEALSG
jgi:two-component system sensor histidine kinase RegB